LNSVGAQISGIGTNTLTIQGVEKLAGGTCRIAPDYLEVGSFIGLAAVTHSELLIKKAAPEHLRMIRLMLGRLGISIEIRGEDVFVPAEQALRVVPEVHGAVPKIDDGIWPAFPTDMMSIAVVVATQAAGTILIHEKMYEGRLYFVDKLISMGARIILCDPYRAVVVGPSRLHGERLESPRHPRRHRPCSSPPSAPRGSARSATSARLTGGMRGLRRNCKLWEPRLRG